MCTVGFFKKKKKFFGKYTRSFLSSKRHHVRFNPVPNVGSDGGTISVSALISFFMTLFELRLSCALHSYRMTRLPVTRGQEEGRQMLWSLRKGAFLETPNFSA